MPDYLIWPGLILLGVMVGTYGTMIGAGGGFVLVPLLLLIYPDDAAELVTSISLSVVFINAASGTGAYLRQGRIDFLAGNTFAIATIPGAVIGALVTSLLPRHTFDLMFSVVLLALSAFLLVRPTPRIAARRSRRGEVSRQMTDIAGDLYVYSYSLPTGIAISLLVGFMSSLLGIGGGVIHVPAMIQVLHFPAHIATATSQYVLTVTALVGALVHILAGDMDGGYGRAAVLGIGVLIGAQIGAYLSLKIRGAMLVRLLGLALAAVAVRLLVATAFE